MDGHEATLRISLLTATSLALGLLATAIVTFFFYIDSVTASSGPRCQDRVVSLAVSNTCPEDTFLEMHDDGSNGHYIICHCTPQSNLSSPEEQQEGDDSIENPTIVKEPVVIEL